MKNRVIKFRAWYEEEKKMVYSDSDIPEDVDYWDGAIGSRLGMLNYILDDKKIIFQQFTGLKDKNGKEIYEGDIVKITTGLGKNVGLIEWIDNGWWVRGEHGLGLPGKEYREVIGNIYSNPKLLK